MSEQALHRPPKRVRAEVDAVCGGCGEVVATWWSVEEPDPGGAVLDDGTPVMVETDSGCDDRRAEHSCGGTPCPS